MSIIAKLTQNWGVRYSPLDGKTVWTEQTLPPAPLLRPAQRP
ncbi:hypothetical protein ACWCYL_18835 [Streptomyces sp. 900105755]